MVSMRRTSLPVLVLLLAASALAQTATPPPVAAASVTSVTTQFASSKDPGVQKAKKILDDMIAALGGPAYLNVRDMKTEGRGYSFYHGKPNSLGVEFWRFWEWPDKDRVELTKQRDVIELNLGDKGYEITYKGTGTQDPKQLEEYNRRQQHSLELVIRQWLPAPGTMILYEGTALVEQNLADQVTVLSTNNDSVTLSIDPRSHLPVRKTYSWRDPQDRQMDEEWEVYGNYRLVQGIQTPYTVVRSQNGDLVSQRFLTLVSYNNGLPPSLFEPKGQIYNQPKSAQQK
jgi:hypothetical protein